MMQILNSISSLFLPLFVLLLILYGLVKNIPIYHSFVRGGKEGVALVVEILPSLVAMIVAIEVLQASGAIDYLLLLFRPLIALLHIPEELLFLAIMRSLSGSGAQAFLIEIFSLYGPDSYLGRAASVLFGSTETTFYIVTVYFGAIHIKDLRHSLFVGLFSDVVGFLAAILFTAILLGSL